MAGQRYTLVLLRHGESEWNAKNLFTGWVDVDLSAKGRVEATRGGQLLTERGLLPDVVHTSVLRRAINTAQLALDACDRLWIPVRRSWRLNERHYGALQGMDKAQTLAQFGEEQFKLWRRSFDVPPPPLAEDDSTPSSTIRGMRRCRPSCVRGPSAWPTLWSGAAVLVRPGGARSAHLRRRAGRRARQLAAGAGQASGPDLRRGDRRAEHPDRDSAALPVGRRLPSGPPGGEYLDPEAAAAIEAVRNQGRR
jgi:2,3-bisphosphoglycerate-dependent phosphoglycerate mutase